VWHVNKDTLIDLLVDLKVPCSSHWLSLKWYSVNVDRGNIADKLQPRNINVSFTNNSNVAIDILVFTFYSDQLVIDVETGIVNEFFFIILLW